ncbi:MAG: hypothetical protein SPC28_05270 [Alloprevotella sp.]|nr:hypothetical protein [Alloprevotella sp.]
MSGKIILLIMKTILLIVKIILLIVGLETGYAERSQEGQEKCVYMYQCQDKTNPSLVTGLSANHTLATRLITVGYAN